MLDLDEPIKPKWNPLKRTTIKPLRFDEHTFVDLIGMIYKVFSQGKDDILLEKQRP